MEISFVLNKQGSGYLSAAAALLEISSQRGYFVHDIGGLPLGWYPASSFMWIIVSSFFT